MATSAADTYEEKRTRHFAYMCELMPQYIARLSWSREQIEAEQTSALRALLVHARDRSAWHRGRLIRLDLDRFDLGDLRRIPPMTKSDLMAHWDAIVTDPRCTREGAEAHLSNLTSDNYFLGDLHVIASGGSSGTRGLFVFDWHGWAVYWISGMRGLLAALQRTGKASSGPLASVSAYVATHATSALAQTFSDSRRPTVRAPVTLPLSEIVATLNRADPSVLHAYPSMLPALCTEAREGRLRIKPLLLLSTSEPLLPEVRQAAEETWGVPVLNFWAASEAGGTFPCPAGNGMHIGEDITIIEAVDEHGDPVARGRTAPRILVTNLANRVMPLIRYEITDEFRIAEEPCRCGSAYLHVGDVLGRNDDVFIYSGIQVHPLNFRSVLGNEHILEYQVRQTRRGADVTVVGHSRIDVQAIQSALEHRLSELGVIEPHVTVNQAEAIERQSTGKLKRFIPNGAA